MRTVLFMVFATGVGLLVLVLLPAPSSHERERRPAALPSEPVRRDIRNVTPDNVTPAPRIETSVISRLPAISPPAPPPRPPEPVEWLRPQVEAAGVITSRGTTIRIAGIRPLPLDRRCRAADGEDWPCGMFARTAMRQFIRWRAIDCAPAEPMDEQIETRCHLAGHDIGEWLVRQGWAVPDGDAGDYLDALAAAKREHRGQWNSSKP